MSQQGAALQNYNNELVKCLEELCARRDVAAREVAEAEREKTELERELRSISERLARTNETLAARTHTRNQYERTIAQTQAAYTKILESSQTLLTVLKQETGGLGRLTEHMGSPRTDC
ncbi:microtubule nucleation factor SSNA1 [Petromyzon marinus]|uniref:SS nuclear autoantigen 1 n=1 Tax=Petromyzon marinus TaxID=7757 RepID=S4RDK7_PETMA|nr:Sjoegren syndrome nuclear autoantigen 1 [Petromyzon marinus]